MQVPIRIRRVAKRYIKSSAQQPFHGNKKAALKQEDGNPSTGGAEKGRAAMPPLPSV